MAPAAASSGRSRLRDIAIRRERAQEAYERFHVVAQEQRNLDKARMHDPNPSPRRDGTKQAAQEEMAALVEVVRGGMPHNRLQVCGFCVSM